MNWLAHALLSENAPAFRLGNLLPDFLTATELAQLDSVLQPGIACHRWIDAFTDQHPVVRRSIRRFVIYRRVAPVLVDVFYDHFLSVDWPQHSAQSLESFVAEVYGAFDIHRAQLPETLWPPLQRMRAEDWLGSYRDFDGLRRTLARMERRFRRQVDLVGGVAELEKNYVELHADFREFFPALRAAVLSDRLKSDNSASAPASL
ncbi:MAG: ACP phosphodiesterase [Verrucomicrobiota bacterium]